MTLRGNSSCERLHSGERRAFLKMGSTLALGLTASQWIPSQVSLAESSKPLPSVSFGPHRISRLIVGSNPICGYSHLNGLVSRIMEEYFSVDRVVDFLAHCSSVGITTFQSSFNEKIDKSLRRARQQGNNIQWICLANHELLTEQKALDDLIKTHKPIGIAHHGGVTDTRYRNGKMNVVREFLKRVRDTGVQVGLSTHNPEVVDYVEDKGWDLDFYMTCFYRVTRTTDEVRSRLGELPLGEVYLERDPDRMCKMVRQTKRTCLGFKILAAGRRCENSDQVQECFEFAFSNIKAKDATIVGMFPMYQDHAKLNAGHALRYGVART